MAQAVELNGKKILVTFLMHLGDLTLTTPFIHALRKAAPDAHITFLADEKLKDVVLHNPYLDEVITIDKKGKDNSLLALMACARRLSKMDFDVLINLHPNERCSFIDAFTKVKLRCGTTHTMFKPLWDVFTPLNRKIHAADMYLDVLTQLGVKKLEHNGLEIFPSEEYQQHADEFWREHGVFASDKLVGFNIGSAVATGCFRIGELAAAMRRCSLIITNDSGPMHVAISQKVPIVAMYGPSSPKLYGPYTKDATIVTALPPCPGCAGGMKHKCDDMQCMTRLTVEQVVQAAEQMLEQKEK